MAKKKNIKTKKISSVTITEEKLCVEENKVTKKIEFPITFVEYAESLDTYTTRALKVYANIDSHLTEKTKSEWDFLLEQLKFKPIV